MQMCQRVLYNVYVLNRVCIEIVHSCAWCSSPIVDFIRSGIFLIGSPNR